VKAPSSCLPLELIRFEWEIMKERSGIYRESFLLNLGLNPGFFFPLKSSKKQFLPFFFMLEAHGSCSGRMNVKLFMIEVPSPYSGAHECGFLCINACFFIIFECLLAYKMSFDSSIMILPKSSDVLLCRFAWFLRELHQNTLELLCLRKSRIT